MLSVTSSLLSGELRHLIKVRENAGKSQLQDQTHQSDQLKYQSHFTLHVGFDCGIYNLQKQYENKAY